MTSGNLRPVSEDRNFEKKLEKQLGCMAGFLQFFDRHPGRRIYGPKRINSFSTTGSTSPSERSDISAREVSEMLPSSPENLPEKIPAFDFGEALKNSWKLREAPRLSLDSRLRPRDVRTPPSIYASDAYSDKNRRSPSVVARLMGLDALPSAGNAAGLRRSASESRVSRDLHRFVEEPPSSLDADQEIYKQRPQVKQSASNTVQIRRKSYFDAQDFYPEASRTGSRSLCGEIEKRLRMRGIDDPAKDLEALKQILEALQLKGLLRSESKPSNLILDSPIVVMKPIPKPVKWSENGPPRSGSVRRNLVEEKRDPNRRSLSSSDPNPRRKSMNNQPNERGSAVHSSPKSSPRKMSPDPTINRRSNKEKVWSSAGQAEDDTATANSVSSSPLFDHERSRAGRSLLERCDKLLNSIAAFTSAEQIAASDQQPSPVSVLDSSILAEESSPLPVNKRSIDFKDQSAEQEEEDRDWVGSTRPDYVPESEYPDFAYLANVVAALDRCSNPPSDVYCFLEKHHGAASKGSGRHRRLIFDAVFEILDRKRHVSPWESFTRRCLMLGGEQLIKDVWSEVRRLKEGVAVGDLNAAAAGAIQKDLSYGDRWWGDTSLEMSDLVLNVERMVFKDLVVETITELVGLGGRKRIRNPIPRRKLLF